eukprot:1141623-Pelagomonas_calceolata.AAC.2
MPGPSGNKLQRDFQFHACLGCVHAQMCAQMCSSEPRCLPIDAVQILHKGFHKRTEAAKKCTKVQWLHGGAKAA